jgi:predicted  nucleic acid-binding Zn-ribbon protein
MSNQDDLTTQPTALVIMERLQQVETGLTKRIEDLSTQVLSFREDVNTIREDVNTIRENVKSIREDVKSIREESSTFREQINKSIQTLTYRIEVLNEDTLDVRGSQRELVKLMRVVETKLAAS